MSKFDAYFSDIFGIFGKKQGGWSNSSGKNHEAGPLWQSFNQNGEMACITSAWSSGKLALKSPCEVYLFDSNIGLNISAVFF